MAFTAKLGQSASKLGNIQLGIAGGGSNVYDNSVTIQATSSTTTDAGFIYNNTLTISATDSITIVPGLVYTKSTTIDGIASTSEDFDYTPGGEFKAIDSITIDPGFQINVSLALSVTSAFLRQPENIIESVALVDAASATITSMTLTIPLSQTIAAQDSITPNLIGAQSASLTISATDSITSSVQISYNPTITVTAQDSLSSISGQVGFLTMSILSTSSIFVEGYYDNLSIIAQDDVTPVTALENAFNNENPAAVGSVGVSASVTHNVQASNTIHYTQLAAQVFTAATSTQTITYNQTATSSVIRGHSATQTITFTQTASPIRDLKSHLVIAQSATFRKVINLTVAQSLHIAQTLTKTSIMSRNVSDTLTFNSIFEQPIPIVTQKYPGGPGQGLSILRSAAVASIQNKLSRKVILSVANNAIVLPTPQLGDTEAAGGTLTLKRTMNGDTYTYIKQSILRTLKYSFYLNRDKGLELRNFIIEHNTEIIHMLNWKGETWLVNLTNGPFELSSSGRYQPKGERVDVELNFEGIKIAG